MKIALVDNMNNNFFALARYFRDLGIEVDLFLIPGRGHPHFHPKHDTWENLTNATWIKAFPIKYHWKYFSMGYKTVLRKTLLKYEKIVACGPAVGLLHSAGIRVDLFIPYGSDLINEPFISYDRLSKKWIKKVPSLIAKICCFKRQQIGIKSAKKIISNTNWRFAEDAIRSLGCKSINLPRIMVYKESFPANYLEKYSWVKDYDFIVFSPTRHLWKTNSEPLSDFKLYGGTKRNDKLIRAFAHFVKLKIYKSPILILCEYGDDVKFSKELISSLGITTYVKWIPLLPRKEVVILISKANFVADQFREGMSSTSAGTTNEALAYGTPVISNTDGAIFKKDDPFYKAPILEALSEEDIYNYFLDYSKRPLYYKELSNLSVKWFDQNLGLVLAKRYYDLLCKS